MRFRHHAHLKACTVRGDSPFFTTNNLTRRVRVALANKQKSLDDSARNKIYVTLSACPLFKKGSCIPESYLSLIKLDSGKQ